MAASKGTVFRDKPPEPSKDVDNRVFERRFVMVSQGVGSATTVSFSKIESIHCSPAQRSVREEGEPGGKVESHWHSGKLLPNDVFFEHGGHTLRKMGDQSIGPPLPPIQHVVAT